jgi:hypothetical protein
LESFIATTIDQPGTISAGVLSVGGDFIIESISGVSTVAVDVTIDTTLGVSLAEAFTA